MHIVAVTSHSHSLYSIQTVLPLNITAGQASFAYSRSSHLYTAYTTGVKFILNATADDESLCSAYFVHQ